MDAMSCMPICPRCHGNNLAQVPGDQWRYLPTVGLSFAHFRCLACGHEFTAGRPSMETERKRYYADQARARHFPSDLMRDAEPPRRHLRPEWLFRDE